MVPVISAYLGETVENKFSITLPSVKAAFYKTANLFQLNSVIMVYCDI